VSIWCPYACHYAIQIHINWPTEKENVRWKFHLSIGSNGQTIFQWTFSSPLDPLDPMDIFVRPFQRPTIYLHDVHMLVITSLKYILIDQLKKQMSDGSKFHLSIGSNGQTKFQCTFSGPLDPSDPMDIFVWLSQWPSIYMMSICLSLRHSNTF
jgi:hypothetical protein